MEVTKVSSESTKCEYPSCAAAAEMDISWPGLPWLGREHYCERHLEERVKVIKGNRKLTRAGH